MKLGRKQKKERSIFRTILVPMMLLLVVETVLLVVVPTVGGVFEEMDRNREEILEQQVKSRKGNLESYMTNNWSDLSRVSAEIDEAVMLALADTDLDMEALLQDQERTERLMKDITDDVISELYLKRASGIYLMFNTQDLRPARIKGELPACQGLYIRDLDPESAPSAHQGDLTMVRGPKAVAYAGNLTVSGDWRPLYVFGPAENPANYDFLYQPFQAAYETHSYTDVQNFGYWAPGTSAWFLGEERFVTYSQPLMLPDGTVYGVIGIELLDEDMMSMVPHSEFDLKQGDTYAVAKVHRKWTTLYLENVLVSGQNLHRSKLNSNLPLTPRTGKRNAYSCEIEGKPYYVCAEPLRVYSKDTPYAHQEWMMLGFTSEEDLYALSTRTQNMLRLSMLVVLAFGLIGSLLISRQLSGPIQRMADQVSKAGKSRKGIPELPPTSIQEIDRFAQAITDLSREVVHASTRFLRIIEMAAGEISGFEVREGEQVFLTHNYFTMLGLQVDDKEPMTQERFMELMGRLRDSQSPDTRQDGSCVYQIQREDGTRYVRVSVTKMDDTITGIAEDVTPQMVEQKRIEHDRDYDLLTKQLNRLAFFREVDRVFQGPDKDRYGALIMMDLDDLKKINDRFGHDWGDHYIQQGVRGFVESSPENGLLARLGGDEFVLFLHGYDDEEILREDVRKFAKGLRENTFATPSGDRHPVRVSCGVAWYPQDSRDFKELMKFADFAMYQIKRGCKGSLGCFDPESFRQQAWLARKRKELRDVLAEQRVQYHFQPIFSAADGQVYAYEALMRVRSELLPTPDAVIQLAREENCLADVERITMFRSAECYQKLVDDHLVDPRAYLFVNSLADQLVSAQDQEEISRRYGDLAPRIVIEITEAVDLNPEILEKKRRLGCFSGYFALDDYGSGYNGEKNLLELSPPLCEAGHQYHPGH